MFDEINEVEEETLDTPEAEELIEDVVEDTDDEGEEDVDALKARLAKAEELANNYKVRAEKAESKTKKAPAAPVANGLSTADTIALVRANVNDEDIDEILEYARFKKISVSEALKSDVVQATLSTKEEKRKSAQAVYTGTARRASTVKSDDRLLDDARAGKLPESEAEIARLAELRLKNRNR